MAATSQQNNGVSLLTGGCDRHYTYGLTMALASRGMYLDLIGSDEIDNSDFHKVPNLRFLNLRGNQNRTAHLTTKVRRILAYYVRLLEYTLVAKPRIFHILWNNKLQLFDRTILMLYYKAIGKRIVLTAHNVNAGKRDRQDSLINRATLRIQYRLADHIFVHTEKMKQELIGEFSVDGSSISVIPFGINNAVPHTSLSKDQARRDLGINTTDRAILFFGNIAPYKGLDFLISAFQKLTDETPAYRLIIAGRTRRGCESYADNIQQMINTVPHRQLITQKIGYVPDHDIERYFKAADVVVLPYLDISQSGILFLAYSFGVPVIVTDVGSLRNSVVPGKTGFVCRPGDAGDLASAIKTYFQSDLFNSQASRRKEIREYAGRQHSWAIVAERTQNVYSELLRES